MKFVDEKITSTKINIGLLKKQVGASLEQNIKIDLDIKLIEQNRSLDKYVISLGLDLEEVSLKYNKIKDEKQKIMDFIDKAF